MSTTLVRDRAGRASLVAGFLAMALIAETTALGPAAPGVARRLGISLAAAGMLVPLHNAGAVLGFLWWGRAQGRAPSSRLLAFGAGLLLTGSLVVASNPGAAAATLAADDAARGAFLALLGGVLLLGLGFGLLDAGVNTVLATRGIGVGTLNAMHGTYGLAAIGFPLLVGLVDLRAAFLLVAVGAVVLFVPIRRAPYLRRPPVDGGAAAGRSRPWVVMLAVAMGVEAGAGAWAAAHVVSTGRTEAAAGVAVAAFFAAFTAARFLLAVVADRFDPAVVVRGGLVLAAVAALVAMFTPLTIVAWVLVGIGIGPVFPTTMAWLISAHEDDRATTRLMLGGAAGGTVLPALIGGAVAVFGAGAIPVAIALIAVAALHLARRLPSGVSAAA